MSALNLIAVFAENKPGQTAAITGILAQAGISIRWVTIANSGSFGVMKLLVDQCDAALAALRAKGLMASPVEVIAVEVENRPGALHAVAEMLAARDINLTNCSGFVANNRAVLVVESQQLPQARGILQSHGLRLLSQAEMLSL